ncbi:ABC transporter ATP-binding protein [Xylanimonas ulmi]|uniref:Iron complex transport system ATP-binding protein n=1 Tax=Xylanimonas ulmi TaxID=228973 RepID=A0A4Q7M076_9MICO|nr:ABC transporter ATP-binding protein [Xylanibacterium ulmi]RZS61136.1 iron complex transport system ATP-binding protein [Xylanibacterium ulmi]
MSWVLDLHGVTVRRGATTILDALDWQVADGERWIVLGPNGAGKTTLMQIASARMHPTSGTATLLGETLGRVDVFELRPRIGLASAALAEQIPGDELVRDVVVTAAYGVTGRWREQYEELDTERATELLRAFDVDALANRTYGTLSEGERKRVQIARALMTDPELLILDEPGAGLDLGGREELVSALAELARDPHSPVLLLVTHHVEEIPPGFTHMLLLGPHGAVQAAGPLEEVLTSQNLSAAFGLDLLVAHGGGRWLARAATPAATQGRHQERHQERSTLPNG